MGTDIHVRVAKYHPETNLFHELELFRKRKPDEKEYDWKTGEELPWTEYKKVYIELGRDYEMFDGMKHGDEQDGFGYFPWTSIAEASLEPSLKEEITKFKNTDGYFDFYEINLADMKNYLHSHPTVVDYESEEWDNWETGKPKPLKDNPIKRLMEIVRGYIFNTEDTLYDPDSYYKIIFFFDC